MVETQGTTDSLLVGNRGRELRSTKGETMRVFAHRPNTIAKIQPGHAEVDGERVPGTIVTYEAPKGVAHMKFIPSRPGTEPGGRLAEKA